MRKQAVKLYKGRQFDYTRERKEIGGDQRKAALRLASPQTLQFQDWIDRLRSIRLHTVEEDTTRREERNKEEFNKLRPLINNLLASLHPGLQAVTNINEAEYISGGGGFHEVTIHFKHAIIAVGFCRITSTEHPDGQWEMFDLCDEVTPANTYYRVRRTSGRLVEDFQSIEDAVLAIVDLTGDIDQQRRFPVTPEPKPQIRLSVDEEALIIALRRVMNPKTGPNVEKSPEDYLNHKLPPMESIESDSDK